MSERAAISLGELAAAVGATLHGDAETRVDRVADLEDAAEGAIAFLAHPRLKRALAATRASAVLLREADRERCPVAALVCDNPHVAFARVAARLHPAPRPPGGAHPAATVAEDAQLGRDVSIAAGAVVEAGARLGAGVVLEAGAVVGRAAELGDDCWIGANAVIAHGCRLGARVQLHPGAVIGADGFGYARDGARWEKVPQIGRVVLGDDVEIGASSTVDRGAIHDTVIERGVKLDAQVHVGHNCWIGEHTVVAGCSGISGSTHIGRRCMIGGGVGVNGHIAIADDVQITGMTMVTDDLPEAGLYSSGIPVAANRRWRRNAVRFAQLDDMARRLKALEQRLATLEADDGGKIGDD